MSKKYESIRIESKGVRRIVVVCDNKDRIWLMDWFFLYFVINRSKINERIN